jgi:polyhydroxyalkanoate synthesis regulator phasin
MNSDHLLQLVQTGFRVTLGATASLVETLQDAQKREQNLSQIRSRLSERVQEWAEKGEITEQEARNFVDSFLQQRQERQSTTPAASDTAPVATTTTPATSPDVQLEMQELTAQIAAMRAELEKLRNPESDV